jgi:drug/metabolite transporter (DMT)-like permease
VTAASSTVGHVHARWTIHARLMGMALLWGASWPLGRMVALAMPPLSAAAWRFAIAVAVMVAWVVISGRGWPRLSARQWAGLALGGVIGVFAYAVFFMHALQHVDASRGALVVTTNPLFTTLLAAWLFRERLTWRVGIGLVCAVAGAVIVLTQGQLSRLWTGGIGVGEWLLVACVASWVIYTLIGRALLQGVDALTATTVASSFGMLLLFAAALALDGPQAVWQGLVDMPATTQLALVVLAVACTVLAYVWYYDGIAALGAGAAARYIGLVPVFGVVASIVMLGERPDASLWVGGALALAGLAVSNARSPGKARSR